MTEVPADRRARKWARTHDELRVVAQRLFAERGFDAVTVADVAQAADVAVQTVFNHYPTKEDLYFAGRAPWVEGPARAVAHRAPGTGAVATAHAWITRHVLAVPGLLRRRPAAGSPRARWTAPPCGCTSGSCCATARTGSPGRCGTPGWPSSATRTVWAWWPR